MILIPSVRFVCTHAPVYYFLEPQELSFPAAPPPPGFALGSKENNKSTSSQTKQPSAGAALQCLSSGNRKELSAPANKETLEQKWKPKPSHPKQKNHQLENPFYRLSLNKEFLGSPPSRLKAQWLLVLNPAKVEFAFALVVVVERPSVLSVVCSAPYPFGARPQLRSSLDASDPFTEELFKEDTGFLSLKGLPHRPEEGAVALSEGGIRLGCHCSRRGKRSWHVEPCLSTVKDSPKVRARATLGVNTPKSGNPNHSFNDNGRRKHTKIVRLPSLRFRAIGRTTDTIRSTPQSIAYRKKFPIFRVQLRKGRGRPSSCYYG
ncbi:hypothetical protein KY285_012182 [Solanum tuberosum]|nr:hypothetical protein KY285_012182 [Solanum tuberosum]